MKRKNTDTEHNNDKLQKHQKKTYNSVVALECNCENFCNPCNDLTIRSITMLVSTEGEKQPYQFSTYETNYTEKDILEKSLNVLKKLKSFKLIGYGISTFDLDAIVTKCDKYELNYKNLFSENTIDLHREIPKYIKLQQYRLGDVTKKNLNKELSHQIDNASTDINAVQHCKLYLEISLSLNMLSI